MIDILTSEPALMIYAAGVSWIVRTYVPWANPFITGLIKVLENSKTNNQHFIDVAETINQKKQATYLKKHLLL